MRFSTTARCTIWELSGTQSYAYAINNHGQVVGRSYLAGNDIFRPFIYDATLGMRDLTTLIDPSQGWELNTITDINDAGQMTGYGNRNGESHALLLTPVPEPSTMVLAACGLLVPLAVRRRTAGGNSR